MVTDYPDQIKLQKDMELNEWHFKSTNHTKHGLRHSVILQCTGSHEFIRAIYIHSVRVIQFTFVTMYELTNGPLLPAWQVDERLFGMRKVNNTGVKFDFSKPHPFSKRLVSASHCQLFQTHHQPFNTHFLFQRVGGFYLWIVQALLKWHTPTQHCTQTFTHLVNQTYYQNDHYIWRSWCPEMVDK